MAGHSKWANIQHRKGAQDKKRANVFTKIAREITVAAKLGDPDPDTNPRLRLAMAAARKASMPNDNIKRAIAKADPASGEGDYQEMRYEGYAPGAIAIIVEALSDNKNRTASEVRSVFTKQGGSMGAEGSVAFSFNREGMIMYKAEVADEDTMMEAAIEAGAENCESSEEGHIVTCAVEDFHTVSSALSEKFGDAEKAELTWTATNTVEVSGEKAEKLEKFIDALEDLDDVQKVFTNAEFE